MTEINKTTVTELATAIGVLGPTIEVGLEQRPGALRHVTDSTWSAMRDAYAARQFPDEFAAAFANGQAFLEAQDGLRNRRPRLVEWKGRHRPPGDDVTPADLRVDHVFQISCKYHSRVLLNAGPPRLFDHLLASERRTRVDWFLETAPDEYQAFYEAAARWTALDLPGRVAELTTLHRSELRDRLRDRMLPDSLREPWASLVARVASASAERWSQNLGEPHAPLRMLWRLTRIGDAPYFLLGAAKTTHLRLRVASRWDWVQRFELRTFEVHGRPAGQPEVAWRAVVRDRTTQIEQAVEGHVEVRWSHGRFGGLPEAKVYLDTPIDETPGYFPLT